MGPAEISALLTNYHEKHEALKEARAELDLLRSLVGDRLEEQSITVAPENVADVMRWARNAQHVRELLKHTPTTPGDEYETPGCPRCEASASQIFVSDAIHDQRCPIAAAWRALGDPRGAEDIERAHEEALRENQRRRGREWNTPYGVARLQMDGSVRAVDGRLFFEHHWGRVESDARGMEAVEAEARELNVIDAPALPLSAAW